MKLLEKVALITGGARMGETLARALGERGCRIVLTWRTSRASAERSAAALNEWGIKTTTFPCDLSKAASIQKLLRSIEQKLKRLDIVVNMASNYEKTPLSDKNLSKAWDEHLCVDAKSSYLLSAAAAPLMRKGGGGRIVLLSDWLPASGRPRYKDHSTYYVAKGAVKAVTEALALELAPSILVNAIAPGPILAPKDMPKKEYIAVEKATPIGRWGGPEEIAKAALFLIETDFVTGETIRVDGGRHLN